MGPYEAMRWLEENMILLSPWRVPNSGRGRTMLEELIISGFGGQGVMVMGQLLSYAGLFEGRTFRGYLHAGRRCVGALPNCSVVISTDPIGSPIVSGAPVSHSNEQAFTGQVRACAQARVCLYTIAPDRPNAYSL